MIAPAASPALLVETEDFAQPAAVPRSDDVRRFTARLAAGDDAAWEEFHARYFGRLLGYLFVVCRGDEQVARDALQTAFAKVVRHMRRFDDEESLWRWLAVVARSCVVDESRRRSRYRAMLERYASFFFVRPSEPADEPLPRLLERCLGELPGGDRSLLADKYEERLSVADLAARHDCSVKAMESRLARLRASLKARLLEMLRHENR